jgi:hypothetical protein
MKSLIDQKPRFACAHKLFKLFKLMTHGDSHTWQIWNNEGRLEVSSKSCDGLSEHKIT